VHVIFGEHLDGHIGSLLIEWCAAASSCDLVVARVVLVTDKEAYLDLISGAKLDVRILGRS
jgi:hypothetical protein